MAARGKTVCQWVASAVLAAHALAGQQTAPIRELQSIDAFSSEGQVVVNGKQTPYLVRHLPASSFPALSAAVAEDLVQRGCLIPQTYEAHGPENVIHGSFSRAGSKEWAVLCSVRGPVSLLVFFQGAESSPTVLSTVAETARLEWNGASQKMEFDWGIDTATPELVHEAQSGMRRRPAKPDHDAIASSVVNGETVFRFYTGSAWTFVDTTD
jgi:hypothetical protein